MSLIKEMPLNNLGQKKKDGDIRHIGYKNQ